MNDFTVFQRTTKAPIYHSEDTKIFRKRCRSADEFSDDLFCTYEQAVFFYKFTVINYIRFHDKRMLLAGECGDANGNPQFDKTNHLQEAHEFGLNIYPN